MFAYQPVGRKRRKRTPFLHETLLQDFEALASEFEQQLAPALSTQQSDDLAAASSSSVSSPWDIFISVWRKHNVALVHSQVLPSRNDPEAFVQLLYEVCLQLIQNSASSVSPNGDTAPDPEPREATSFSLFHAAFGVFSLYAIRETCPLPKQPETNLAWLPIGLIHPDNPKLLYRRRYCPTRIRIDRESYLTVKQLQHFCLGRMRYNTLDGRLATQISQIVAKLEWEFSEYPGPRGVDALAVRSKCASRLTEISNQSTPNQSTEELVQTAGLQDHEVIAALHEYKTKLQAVQVSSNSQQAKRVKSKLAFLGQEKSLRQHGDPISGERRLAGGNPEAIDELELPKIDGTLPPRTGALQVDASIAPRIKEAIERTLREFLEQGETQLLSPEQRSQEHNEADISDVSDDVDAMIDHVGESESDEESTAGLGALKALLRHAQSRPAKWSPKTTSARQGAAKGRLRAVGGTPRNSRPPRDEVDIEEQQEEASIGRMALSTLLNKALGH
jgi:hypothetical protein